MISNLEIGDLIWDDNRHRYMLLVAACHNHHHVSTFIIWASPYDDQKWVGKFVTLTGFKNYEKVAMVPNGR